MVSGNRGRQCFRGEGAVLVSDVSSSKKCDRGIRGNGGRDHEEPFQWHVEDRGLTGRNQGKRGRKRRAEAALLRGLAVKRSRDVAAEVAGRRGSERACFLGFFVLVFKMGISRTSLLRGGLWVNLGT